MNMKKLLTILCTTLLLTIIGCQHDEPMVEPEVAKEQEFTAKIEGFVANTKTQLANRNSVVWSKDDQIAIFQGASVADKYQVNDYCIGSMVGTFNIVTKVEATESVTFDTNIALYPFEDGLTCTPTVMDGKVTSYQITGVTIPTTQTYADESFPEEAFIMAALTDGINDKTLNFKNICGAIKLQLKGTMAVKRIELRGNDDEKLSGDATISIYPGTSFPAITMNENASDIVILDCGDGVVLRDDIATTFILTVPPTDFEKGFTAYIIDTKGNTSLISTSRLNTVNRSYLHEMPSISVKDASEESLMAVRIEDGSKMTIRCKDWTDSDDFVWTFNGTGGTNRTANLNNCGTIPESAADESLKFTMSKTLYKSCTDDTAPVSFNGSYFAGNHAMTGATKIVVENHNLTESDIGSTWTDSDPENPVQYMLARVDSDTKLTFINLSQQITSGNGPFNYAKHIPVSPLVHVKNATNKSDIGFTGYTNSEQLWSGSNHITNRYFVDDIEVKGDGLYHGSKVYNVCTYDVIYVPAILEYLEKNVGHNTNSSHSSDEITEKYLSIEIIHEFRPNGSQTTYCKYTLDPRSSLKFSYIYAAQCAAFSKPVYLYVPGAYQDDVFLHDGTGTYQFVKDNWNDPNIPPYRYFMLNSDKTKGFELIYSRDTYLGNPSNRINHLTYAGWSPTSCKLYPIWVNGSFDAGSSFDSITGRIPLNMSLSEGTTAVGWYWENEDIIITIDSHSICAGVDIPLSCYMQNKKVEILDKTDSVISEIGDMTGESLHYETDSDIGYLVVRLFD